MPLWGDMKTKEAFPKTLVGGSNLCAYLLFCFLVSFSSIFSFFSGSVDKNHAQVVCLFCPEHLSAPAKVDGFGIITSSPGSQSAGVERPKASATCKLVNIRLISVKLRPVEAG